MLLCIFRFALKRKRSSDHSVIGRRAKNISRDKARSKESRLNNGRKRNLMRPEWDAAVAADILEPRRRFLHHHHTVSSLLLCPLLNLIIRHEKRQNFAINQSLIIVPLWRQKQQCSNTQAQASKIPSDTFKLQLKRGHPMLEKMMPNSSWETSAKEAFPRNIIRLRPSTIILSNYSA